MEAAAPGALNLLDPESYRNGPPHAYLRRLRREAPVCWHEKPQVSGRSSSQLEARYWLLTRYQDVVDVSRNPRVFSSSVGTCFPFDPDAAQLPGLQMQLINMDPPEHAQYRRLVQRGFTPRTIAELDLRVRAHARRIVDDVARKGGCEFVSEIACQLPLFVICDLMGIPEEDRGQIAEWSNLMIGADDAEISADQAATRASVQLWMYANTLVQTKRERPDESLISKLVNGEAGSAKISHFDLNNFFVLLWAAGNETPRNATSQFMRVMSEHPEQLALLLSDVDRYLPTAIEEVLRFAPPVLTFRRTAVEDTEIGGARVRKGDKVLLSYPAANRDESVFKDPDRFDIRRSPNHHLSFGVGEHVCLGAHLARVQLRAILREVFTRLPDIHLVKPPVFQRSNLIYAIREMWVGYTPET
jgi:cytochrome P450